MAISARIKDAYPYADYGRAYYRRGTPENLARFGASFRAATEEQRALRKSLGYVGAGRYRRGLVGRGGYFGRVIGRGLGGLIGLGDAGAAIGDKLGDLGSAAISTRIPGFSRIADAAGSVASRIFGGSGSYVTNALIQAGGSDPVPKFGIADDVGTIVITHREYVSDVYAPNSMLFTNSVYNINPGLEPTFPWLSQVAQNYEEYELKQCIYTYKSTVADFASASGQVGQITMAVQYNAGLQPFGDKQTMMQYTGAVSGKTSEDILCGVECNPHKNSGSQGKFVRNGPIPVTTTADINAYDLGTLNIAVSDVPATYYGQQLGELWCSYTLVLRKPKFVTANGWGIGRSFYFMNATAATNMPYSNPWGVTASPDGLSGQQNNLGIVMRRPDKAAQLVTDLYPAGSDSGQWGQFLAGANRVGDPDIYQVGFIFPPSYSGQIEMKVRTVCGEAAPNSRLCFSTLNGSQITPLNDIPTSATPTIWTNAYGDGTDGPGQGVTWVAHLRIRQSINGVPNIVILSIKNGDSSTLLWESVDFSEYNTIFNYAQDGSNDRVVLQNPFAAITSGN